MGLAEIVKQIYLPQALSIGIDYNLFWTLNPAKLKPFVEAEKIKRKNQLDDMNCNAWLQGYYNMLAIGGAMNGSEHPYPKQALSKQTEKDIISERKAKAIEFEAWAIKFNKHILKTKGGVQ
jgi:hypothetical protein